MTKHYYIKFSFLIFFLCSLNGSLLAQNTYVMGDDSPDEYVQTGDIFYDSGGSGRNYRDRESGTITFNSAPGTVIRMIFTEFKVENGGSNDYLNAYDGNGTSSLIGKYYGTYDAWQATTRPSVITSSGNSLTFFFKSSMYSNYSGWEATIEVLDESDAFCIPSIDNYGYGNNQYISNVSIGSIDNDSNSDGYTDYTDSQSTDVEIGTGYLLTVTNSKYNIYWGSTPVYIVWVDWNQDGDFEDTGETIASESGAGVFTTTVTPPFSAVIGTTWMRVRVNHTDTATPCENTTWGEVEDYTLNVTGSDDVPPVFQNPQGNISKETDDGICGAVVTYPFPVATDNVAPSSEPIAGYSFLGEFNSHTYYYSNNSLDVAGAIQAGDGIGGHLVSLESQAENDFIDSKVDDIWIGLTDVSNEGTFEWLTGEDVLYTNWNGGEPNDYGSGEDYTEMTANGSWNDLSGTNSRRYVIEFEGTLVTQTGGLSSGSIFPVGTTVNTFLATDNAGNTATHSFNVTVVDVTPPKISGLKADYYDGINFDDFKESLTVDELNYDWGSDAPESSLVGADDFSIRFQGNVQAPQTGTYTFYTTSDDGVRLWVDGQLIVDNWTNHSTTVNSGTVNLTANQMASLQLEFYEQGGAAVVKLEWEGPGVSRKFISDNGAGSCQDITVDVSETGSYNLTVDEVDPGYTDACGTDTRTLSKSIFTCDDVGSNPVTFTVADVNGNTSECSFNVLVTGGPAIDQIVAGDSVCQGVDAQVFIRASETDVIYSAYSDGVQIGSSVAGNGSDINITVPTSSFSIGDNQIYLKAVSGSCEVSLSNSATIVVFRNPNPIGIYHE